MTTDNAFVHSAADKEDAEMRVNILDVQTDADMGWLRLVGSLKS